MIDSGARISASHGRRHRRARLAILLATTALSSPFLAGSAPAQNLPAGGSVAAGSVAIAQPSATQLNITQSSQSAVVNWQSFSIGQGSTVNIQQPNSTSALLNRVTGNTPSSIAGSLTANGQVYLVNPNGIAITPSGVVNTGGGFVASTLGISDADFQAGKRTFTGNGASAAVSNAGIITVGRGGYAALLGGSVSNTGRILVPLGQVGLGSGERATLDFSGDGFLQVAMPTAAAGNGALIRNAGSIRADGGSVVVSAATAREAARNAVNISGVIQARSIGGRSGSISIGGGAGGNVNVSGRLTATSRRGSGGSVAVTGQSIALEGASLDVSGRTGGGTINVGGGRQGHGPLQQADSITVDAKTTIRADATTSGNGGDVVLWSNQLTRFAGTITARGGAQGGNGGEAEVSGKAKLDYTGFTNLAAANGRFGTLLLDPYNVIISGGANNTGGSFDANTNDSIINAATLQTALGAANVTITTGTSGSQAGNITVAAPLTWAAATTLGLNAAGTIAINAPISITGAGGLELNANAQAGVTTTGLIFGNGGSVDYGAVDLGGTFSLNGNSYTLVYSMAQLDAIDAVNAVDGSALDIHGTGLAGNYALATNLNAAGTTFTQALIGTNVSEDVDSQFTGRLDGLGHTVTGLTIDAPGTSYVGLLGYVGGAQASVSNIGVVGGSVTGQDSVGPLVGWLEFGTVQNSFSSAAVTGSGANAGGLIGLSTGTVQSSHATGTVVGNFGAGGLVGWALDTGVIANSHATGAVTGATFTGGLIGFSYASVTASHATGAVTGTALSTGGLIGRNERGSVTASYASGAVSGVQNTGGLIGINLGIVEASYATGAVTATGNRTGGLIGQNGSPIGQSVASKVRASYATGAVTGTTNSGGLVGLNSPTGTVDSSYATGTVAGTAPTVGGLVGGNNAAAGTVTNSYWDTQTSGLTASAGGSGRTTAQLQGALPGAFNATDWGSGAGLYPYLNWQFAAGTTPQSVSGVAHQANGTALIGATIAGSLDGAAFAGTTSTGANGYYYFLLPQGSTAQGSGIFVDIAGNAVKANGYVRGGGGPVQNLDLNAATLNIRTDATALSSLASSLAAASAGTATTDLVFSTPGGVLTPNAGTGLSIAASGAFNVDQALAVPNSVLLNAAASLTIASTGSLSSATGNATLTGSKFTNNAGATAVSTPNGRWLIYSSNPGSDNRGGLAYDFKQYGASYGATAVAQATGNGFLYSVVPTVGLTGTVGKIYDGSTGATPGSLVVSGIDGDVLASTYSDVVYGDANVGTGKTVTVSGLAITAASNGSAVVYGYGSPTTVSGTIGTITARPITVTADAQSRVYGDANPALTYAIGGSGLVNNDALSGSLITGATTATGVGSYGINLGNLAAGSNYALTYVGANLAVTPRPLTVTADAQSRVYGDANPALTYAIGGSGLVNNDALSGGLTTGATNTTGVGSYGINLGNLAAGGNYALSYVGANLAVTPRPILISADAQSRPFGDANPALTYSIGARGLVNGDSLAGSLTTDATSASATGAYAIAQGTLSNALNANYAISYRGANLVVGAEAATATAPAAATAATPAPTASPFIVATPETPAAKQTVIGLQLDQPAQTTIAPLTVRSAPPAQAADANKSDQPTRIATRQDADDDIVTGSTSARDIKSADGFVYKPLSQFDATQYSGNTLPDYAGQTGEAAIFTMLVRGALGSSDKPRIDNLFDPGDGVQWKGVNWDNPLASKVSFSDGTGHTGAPADSFPIQLGKTDLAALLGKGPMILTGSANTPNAASFALLGVAMTVQGIVANDPGTGRQLLLTYNSETKTPGPIASILDPRTGIWTSLADAKPTDGGLSQTQLDQLARMSVDRFAAVSVAH